MNIFSCSSCCLYCRNKILKIKPTVFLCLHSGGWTGEKNSYNCKKRIWTACDLSTWPCTRKLVFCFSILLKKKRQSVLNGIPVWPGCSSAFNKTGLWQISTFFLKELGPLKEFSKFFILPIGCLTFERNRIQDGFFFLKNPPIHEFL